MTFSPCCKWVLVECEGIGEGEAEGGERLGGGVEWGPMGGNHSGENGSCGEKRA